MPRLHVHLTQLLVLLCCADVAAAEQDPASQQLPSWWSTTGSWLEQKQGHLSEVVLISAEGVDGYLAREELNEPASNQSYVRIQLRERFQKAGEHEFEADIKAKLKLPNTKRQLRLTFDSDPDDFETISNRRRDRDPSSTSTREVEDTSVIGLAWLQELGANWVSDYNVGIRTNLPLDPYVRANFHRVISLSEHWESHLQQKFSYFHHLRGRAETSLDLFRPLTDTLTFQSATAAQFIDRDDNWELYQALSLHQRVSSDGAFQHQIGISGDTRPNTRSRSYWIRSEYRHRLYKNWLYGKVAPELFFNREGSFKLEPILLFELEIYFGHSRDRI